jgi:tetratricopeptide (TPR) repeat protein
LATVLAASGEFAQAEKNYQEGLELSKEAGEKHELAVAASGLGDLHLQQGDFTAAREHYETAQNARKELGEKEAIAESQLQLATLAIEEGHSADGLASARQALAEFQAEKMTAQQLWAYAVISRGYLLQGKLAEAQKSISQGSVVAKHTQQRDVQLQFQIASARVQATNGKRPAMEGALRALESVAEEAQRAGFTALEYEAALGLGEIQTRSGKDAEGRARLTNLQKDASSRGFLLISQKAGKALGKSSG